MSKPQMNYKIRSNKGEITAGLGWLFTLLWLHCDNMLRCFPSNELLMDEMGVGTASITKYRNQLIEMKALIIVPTDKRMTERERNLHQRKYVYQITGMIQLPSGAILETMHFNTPDEFSTHLSILSDLSFDINPLFNLHQSKFHNLKLSDFSIRSSTSLKASKVVTNSFAEKSAKDAALPEAISDATKKGSDAPEITSGILTMSQINEKSSTDWKAKFLGMVGDAWVNAADIELVFNLPDMHLATDSDTNAYKALHDLEHDQILAYKPAGNDGQKRREWRLRDDAPEIDWQTKILATLTDDWTASSALENIIDVAYRTLDPLAFSTHPAAIALYALEAERKVEYQAMNGRRREWRLHPDGQPAPKSEHELLELAISRCLDIHNGALGFMTHMLRGTAKTGVYGKEAEHFKDNPVSASELEGMVDYWVLRHPEIDKPSKVLKVSSEMAAYRLHIQRRHTPELNFEVHDEVVEGSMEDMQAKNFELFMKSQDGSE